MNPRVRFYFRLVIFLLAVIAVSCLPKKTEENKTLIDGDAELITESADLHELVKSKEETADGSILIYTEADLRAIDSTNAVSSHYRLMADIVLTGDNDSDPENGNWMPIGGIDGFSGTFDGNGHTITGLRINFTYNFPQSMSAGMFGTIDESGLVENLGLIDANISVGTQGIGAIAGVNNGTIRNCFVTGNIGDLAVKGGIAGSNTQSGTIQNCYFAGSVFHRREEQSHTSGGIAGVSSGNISNCIALAESITEEPETAAGRVVGANRISESEGTLSNNYGWNGTTLGPSYLYYVTVPISANPESKDGADLSAAELKTQSEWERAGFSFDAGSIWAWNGANAMPSLKNQKTVVSWPEYLENPAVSVPSPNMGETGFFITE